MSVSSLVVGVSEETGKKVVIYKENAKISNAYMNVTFVTWRYNFIKTKVPNLF